MAEPKYIHGFAEQERQRLLAQGKTLADFVYPGVDLSDCASILEVGSGVGAQTLQLLERFPHAHITCVELSEEQLKTARLVLEQPIHEKRVTLICASADQMPIADRSFDGAFVCWVLEHVPNPPAVLREIRRVLKKDGKVFFREVFNQLWYTHPSLPILNSYWQSFNDHQLQLGGDPFVGARLGGYLSDAGFKDIKVEFRTPLFDKRDLQRRNEILYYWRDLFLSGDTPTPQMRTEIQEQFKRLKEDPDSSIFFGFAAVRALAS